MWWKIKRRKSDILFSQRIRKERGYRCEKCGRQFEPNDKGFGVSHFWPRAHESVRFDSLNVDTICNIPCHQYFETHRTEYEQWKETRLGTKEYKLLMFRAHQIGKRDDTLQEIIEKKLLT